MKAASPVKALKALENREGLGEIPQWAGFSHTCSLLLLPVPSCPGSLCLQPVPQWGLMLQHPGPRVLPLHLPHGFHRQGLWHRCAHQVLGRWVGEGPA